MEKNIKRKAIYVLTGILLCFLIFVKFFKKETLTKEAISKKIHKAYIAVDDKGDLSLAYKIISFVDENKIILTDSCDQSKMNYIKGVSYYERFEDSIATVYTQIAYEMSKNCSDTLLLASIHNLLGVIYKSKSKDIDESLIAKAVFHYEKAALYLLKLNKINNLPDIYYNLSFAYSDLKKWSKSRNFSIKALKILEETKSKKQSMQFFYANKALCEIHLNQSVEAEKSLKKATSYLSSNSYRAKYMINKNYSLLHAKKKNYKLSNFYMNKAIGFLTTTILYDKKKIINNSIESKNQQLKLKKKDEKIILIQKISLFFIALFFIFTLFYLYKIKHLLIKKRESYLKIDRLNNELVNSNISLEDKNKVLKEYKKEIEHLLKLNERTLFSKVLKISSYNEIIHKIASEISVAIDNKSTIKTSKLLFIEKKLKTLIAEEDKWKDFEIQFEKTRPDFFKKLKNIASDLSVNDLKHCAYIVAKLKVKDVANLLYLSPRSVETTRYRIKKKLRLDKSTNLYEFLDNI